MKNYSRELVINRIDEEANEVQTLGNFFVVKPRQHSVLEGVTLELPWKNNQKNISCIPTGTYECEKYWSWTFKCRCISVLEVPNRSNIKIHPLNFYYNSQGCIGLGEKFVDMNYDGLQDISSSGETLKKVLKELPNRFRLRIS